jgi:glycosyltransferase involved in cell wall biosynthesis
MKILITVPSLKTPHGGIRVIIEWANRLSRMGHIIWLYNMGDGNNCDWKKIDIANNGSCLLFGSGGEFLLPADAETIDAVIITSPHSIHFEDHPILSKKKIFIFAQMAEHLFKPDDKEWEKKCRKFYESSHPMFAISLWNIEEFGRYNQPTYYIGNGVNLEDFPIDREPRRNQNKTLLVEGWESLNPSKDPDALAPQVARILKARGWRVIAYGQTKLKRYKEVPDDYTVCPNLEELNILYRSAHILLKCSKYDARACAPMEAMTKGTPTVRCIDKGDDDLVDRINCWRFNYTDQNPQMIADAIEMLYNDKEQYTYLQNNCYSRVVNYTWDYWMNQINDILNG